MALTNEKMASLFVQAYKENHIELPTVSDFDCIFSDCEKCPAGPACEQLSENGVSYNLFQKNFKEVIPLIREKLNER